MNVKVKKQTAKNLNLHIILSLQFNVSSPYEGYSNFHNFYNVQTQSSVGVFHVNLPSFCLSVVHLAWPSFKDLFFKSDSICNDDTLVR